MANIVLAFLVGTFFGMSLGILMVSLFTANGDDSSGDGDNDES